MPLITGTISDSAGAPANGWIEFTQVSRIDTGSALVTMATATAQVVDGVIRDLDGLPFTMPQNPDGTAVRVLERLGGRTFEWWTQIPATDVEYRSLVPVEPIGSPQFAPPPWLADVYQARDETLSVIETVGGLTGITQAVADAQAAKTAAASSATSAQTAKTGADSAKTAAELARDQAVAVGNTNDTIIAGRVNDSTSATRTALAPVMQGKIASTIVSVNVRDYGAVPANQNGGEGANAGIQAAIDFVNGKGGGEVVVDDDYWIKAHVPGFDPTGTKSILGDQGGVALKDGVALRFTAKGVFRVIPNSERQYVCIRVYAKNNVRVSGPGKIIGDRYAHTPTFPAAKGEWGYGIAVTGGSNISIEDLTITDMWGDGFNIQTYTTAKIPPKNVRFLNITADGNRRQGMSIEAADGLKVLDSRFINTGGPTGTPLMHGIDIEPWAEDTQCSGIEIRRCRFENNSGFGIGIFRYGTRDVIVDDCDFVGNLGTLQFACNKVGPNVRLTRSRFTGTAASGECVHLEGGVGRVVADNVFDSKVRVSWNSTADIAQHVQITRNKFIVTAAAKIDGLVEINEHAIHTEVTNNYFENKGVRGSGVWIRNIDSPVVYALRHIKVTGNTFLRMTTAVISGRVERLEVAQNKIHASDAEAIRVLPAVSTKVYDNHISGSNLVTGVAAIVLGDNTIDTLVSNNLIELEPAFSVTETRRGTKGIQLSWGPTTNTIVRGTLTVGTMSLYDQLPASHTGTYLETTPGSWFVFP